MNKLDRYKLAKQDHDKALQRAQVELTKNHPDKFYLSTTGVQSGPAYAEITADGEGIQIGTSRMNPTQARRLGEWLLDLVREP